MSGVFSRIRGKSTPAKSSRSSALAETRAVRGKSAGEIIGKDKAIARQVGGRQITELVGICRGVLADGALVDPEVKFLAEWMELNVECSDQWPYTALYGRIAAALEDGIVTDNEERELMALLHQVTGGVGGKLSAGQIVAGQSTEGLPYDVPAPDIEFPNRGFCVTGEFAYGSRRDVAEAIEARGGRLLGVPSRRTDFLVVGVTGTISWKHSTHGTKIIRALELRNEGHGLAIVSEQHWQNFL